MRRTMALALGVFLVLPLTEARAQSINVQTFHPSPHPHDYFSVQGTRTLGHLNWNAGLYLNYARNPLLLRFSDGEVHRGVVTDQLTANLLFSLGVLSFMEFAIDFPFHPYVSGQGLMDGAEPAMAGVGDLRFLPRFRLYELYAGRFHLGLGASGPLSFPLGKQIDPYMGNENFTWTPTIMVEMGLTKLIRASLNVGYRLAAGSNVGDLKVDDELHYGLGLGIYPGTSMVEIIVEAYGAAAIEDLLKDNERQLEVVGGVKVYPGSGMMLTAGLGAGALAGYGTPQARAFVGVGYSPPPEEGELDSDGDGLPDKDDRCPLDAEDRDGFEDDDGCPDLDNDKDGIPDASDRCPNVPEDRDGFEDEDGCPDPDNDRDGLLDKDDACPLEPEDKDGFADYDGCPDPDNDGDGIIDSKDQCPDKAENFNDCQDEDGCPEEGHVCVTEVKRKIVTLEKIYFKFGKAVIMDKSFPVLRAVAQALKDNPHIKRILIEGHTDDVGSAKVNKGLSHKRAQAVHTFLLKEGIHRNRLNFKGYGEEKPIAPNDTDEGRSKNRRVEFIILELTGK